MTLENKIMAQKKFFLKKYVLYLKTILKSVIKEIRFKNNDIEIKTTPNNLRSLILFLKNHTLTQHKQLIKSRSRVRTFATHDTFYYSSYTFT